MRGHRGGQPLHGAQTKPRPPPGPSGFSLPPGRRDPAPRGGRPPGLGTPLRFPRLSSPLPKASHRYSPGERRGHPEPPGPGPEEGGPLLPRLHQRGVWRPPGPPPARDLLGQREPYRPKEHLRRGQALRRGPDHRLPPGLRCPGADRAHLQHLWPGHGSRGWPGGLQLHRAGPEGRAPHGVRGWEPNPLPLLCGRPHRGDKAPHGGGLPLSREPGEPGGVPGPGAGPAGEGAHGKPLAHHLPAPAGGRPQAEAARHYPGSEAPELGAQGPGAGGASEDDSVF